MRITRTLQLTALCIGLLVAQTKVYAEQDGKVRILLLGDSTTEGSIPRLLQPQGPHLETVLEQLLAAEDDLPACQVINSSKSGEYIRRLIDSGRYQRNVKDLKGLDYIFVRYGINDQARLEDFESRFPEDFFELISMLRSDHPNAEIILMTVIPFSGEKKSEEMNLLIRQVSAKEKLELFDIYPRYAAELKKGYNMLNYRRYPIANVPEKYHPLVKPYIIGSSVVVMDNELDGIMGDLPGWFSDRHPNLAGYNVIADETAKYLGPLLRKRTAKSGQP